MKELMQIFQSWIPFLVPYPTWVKLIVAAWLFLDVFMFVALLFSPQTKAPSVADAKPPMTVQQESLFVAAPIEHISFTEYFSTLDRLRDRFLEKEEFLKKLTDQTVTWIGYVDNVSTAGSSNNLHMMITETKENRRMALVYFDSSF